MSVPRHRQIQYIGFCTPPKTTNHSPPPSPTDTPIAVPTPENPIKAQAKPPARPWLGVRFLCGGAYIRVYRNPSSPAYLARCPRCAECVRFSVGAEGQSARLYEVDCGRR